jgi:hypothetical protein
MLTRRAAFGPFLLEKQRDFVLTHLGKCGYRLDGQAAAAGWMSRQGIAISVGGILR